MAAEAPEAVATNKVGKGSCCWSEGVAEEDEEGEGVGSAVVDPVGVGNGEVSEESEITEILLLSE